MSEHESQRSGDGGSDGGSRRKGSSSDPTRDERSTGRKLAEWVTMGVSAVLVLGVAGCLLYQALRTEPPFVPARVRVLSDQARESDGRYIVPVEVSNGGVRTLKEIKVKVTYRPAQGGGEETGDFVIDYLGGRATQKVYLYFEKHPRELKVEASPFQYQLE